MAGRSGSWPLLLATGVAFLAAFAWQRSQSSFLRIEARIATARTLARAHGVTPAEAMAVLDRLGPDAADAAWNAAIARYAALSATYGAGLAAVAMAGDVAAVAAAVAEAGGDRDAAWLAFRDREAALPGVRFLLVRDRFASRLDPADRGV